MKTVFLAIAIALAIVFTSATAIAQIPRFDVVLSPGDYDLLYTRDPFSDSLLPATFTTNDTVRTGSGFRFKGTSTRFYAKKSFRLRVPTANLYRGQRDINFNAMYTDRSALREYLAWYLFAGMGELAPFGEHALLSVNGRAQGLYLRIDKVDKYFLTRKGRIQAPMYQADDGFNEADLSVQPDSLLKLYYSKEIGNAADYSDLAALIQALNTAPDSSFADTVDRYFDVPSLLNWFAGNTLMMMGDSYNKNYYLYRDTSRATGQWVVIPWDYDLSFGRTGDLSMPYPSSLLNDRFACTFPPLSGPPAVLKDRFLATPALVERLRARLDTLLATLFTPGRLHPVIDSLAAVVRPALAADAGIWGTMDDFEEHVEALKYYVTARRNYLLATFVHPPTGEYNDVTMPVAQTGVPYAFVAYDGRQLATLTFDAMSGLDSVRVVAHPDSTPPSLAFPGDGRYIRRWLEVIPYPAGATFTARLEWMYEDVSAASSEVGSGVQDERRLRAFVFDGVERRALVAHVNGHANTITVAAVTEADCGQGRHFGAAMAQTYVQTWFRTPLVNWQRWHDVRFLGPWFGWIVGDQGTLLKTSDGGATWAEKAIGFGVTFSNLAVLSADTLLACGNAGAIHRSLDGGENWARAASGVSANLRALSFADGAHGFAGGDGVIVRTTDGGASWSTIVQDSAAAFQSLSALGPDSVLTASLDGVRRYHSTDGGATWNAGPIEVVSPLRALALRGLEAWVAGDAGAVYHRAAPGAAWDAAPVPAGGVLRAVAALPNGDVCVAGDGGAIWYTSDGGASWYAQYSADSHDLFALTFTDTARGYAVGNAGTLLQTTSPPTFTGVREGSTLPAAFALEQNYPNPFNPVTTLAFRTSAAGRVRLTVHDLLGRTVAVLVDDVLPPGEHRATWNAAASASGVYFCRLQALGATLTGKMLLVR